MITPETKLENLPRINQKYAKNLKKLGMETVSDLLFHFPFRYEDYSEILPITKISQGEIVTISGKIISAKTTRTWKKKMFITEIAVADESGTIRAVWFNQPYLSESLVVGKNIRLSGKVSSGKDGLFFSNPTHETASRTPTNTARLVPVYPETEGITSRWLRWQIQNLLKINIKFEDPLPTTILKNLNLPEIKKALRDIHFPSENQSAILAQKRFAFEEMLLVQLKSLQTRLSWEKESSVSIKFNEGLIKNFVHQLPFNLTNAQRKAAFQILKDLEKSRPMNRLLNGDVGSGKTIVAAITSLQATDSGYQVAILAPTEVLARQHFESFSKLLEDKPIKTALLTNAYQLTNHTQQHSLKNKKESRDELISDLSKGKINIIIGTHALLQKDVNFHKLALIIVDEQHRFGVSQRAHLQQKIEKINDGLPKKIPHLLTMSATPIPRTLALAFFGNLDISVLDEMPKNRKKIITKIIPPKEREKIYTFIKNEIQNGRQAFFILPLVEESKALLEVKAAIQEHQRLSEKVFPGFRVGLLHGRMPSQNKTSSKEKSKEEIMADFKNKKYDILVSTSVIEVGIDITNATVIVIEDADRFGLSQLHQFRGRVGRGEYQSYCFLFSNSQSNARLKALAKTEDGFAIAEEDLKLRGPGEFFGTRQAGLPDITMENLANTKLIQVSKEEAANILSCDPQLKKHPLLAKSLKKFETEIHLE